MKALIATLSIAVGLGAIVIVLSGIGWHLNRTTKALAPIENYTPPVVNRCDVYRCEK